MSRKLVVLLLAVALPGTASAWSWGDAGDVTVDVYAAPGLKTDDGSKATSEAFGLKGVIKVYDWLGSLVEYQNQHGVAPAGGTVTDWRAGAGYLLASGTGLFVQYVSQKASGVTTDGFGVRGRLAAHPVPDLNAYLEVGHLSLEDDSGTKTTGLEAAIGGALAITDSWGLYTEYKLTQYAPDVGADVDVEEVRVGLRARFDL